jgi:hypothetical protein
MVLRGEKSGAFRGLAKVTQGVKVLELLIRGREGCPGGEGMWGALASSSLGLTSRDAFLLLERCRTQNWLVAAKRS